MDELTATEAERARRRDRKRVTRMVVDGGNLRRQLESLRLRAAARRVTAQVDPHSGERPKP
ncbi:MAG: hypothetical protein ACYCX9_09610 [Candidatus Dormibacteria bacterium]